MGRFYLISTHKRSSRPIQGPFIEPEFSSLGVVDGDDNVWSVEADACLDGTDGSDQHNCGNSTFYLSESSLASLLLSKPEVCSIVLN